MASTARTTTALPGLHLSIVENVTGATTQIDNPNPPNFPDPGPTRTGAVQRIGNTKIVNPA